MSIIPSVSPQLSLFDGTRCTKCKQWQPLSLFSKDRSRPNGHDPHCKLCKKVYNEANKSRIIKQRREKYLANKGQILARNNAYYASHKAEIQARRKAKRFRKREAPSYVPFKHRCKEYNRDYNLRNRESLRLKKREYREKNREVIRVQEQVYRLANLDKKREYHKKWFKANPDRTRANDSVRRARENGAKGRFTSAEWCNLKEFYQFTCLRCRRSEPEIQLTPDHVQPLSKGGDNGIENIQPLCKSCNCSKHVGTTDYRK